MDDGAHIAVVGAGSWGTAVAGIVGSTRQTLLWARRSEIAAGINETRSNPAYLTSHRLPVGVSATADLAEAVSGAGAVIVGVPSHGYRSVVEKAAPYLEAGTPIISLAKGIEEGTLMRMTEVTADVVPDHPTSSIGVLTGPNLASEIAKGQPAAAVVAFADPAIAESMQQVFMTPTFRVYTNTDVVGAEAAGALKNPLAIAAGMASGLGFGDNTMAALITRALTELTRLGIELGGRPTTFAGLAGMGDLIATCASDVSRNHTVGYQLGIGRSLDEIVGEMNMVAEGVRSTGSILELARRHGVEMPITEQVGRVLYEAVSPAEAVVTLMMREARPEHDHHH